MVPFPGQTAYKITSLSPITSATWLILVLVLAIPRESTGKGRARLTNQAKPEKRGKREPRKKNGEKRKTKSKNRQKTKNYKNKEFKRELTRLKSISYISYPLLYTGMHVTDGSIIPVHYFDRKHYYCFHPVRLRTVIVLPKRAIPGMCIQGI